MTGHSRREWKAAIGEGVHAGFRKGTARPGSIEMWKAINDLDPVMWDEVLSFVVYGLEASGMISFGVPSDTPTKERGSKAEPSNQPIK